jgi:hypothetical protein
MRYLAGLIILGFFLALTLAGAHSQGVIGNGVISAPTPTVGAAVEICPSSGSCGGNNNDDVQALVLANPAGTIFHLKKGVYYIPREIVPLSGDQFIGQNADNSYPAGLATATPAATPGAILDGGYVLTGWTSTTINGISVYYKTLDSSHFNDASSWNCNYRNYFTSGWGSMSNPPAYWRPGTAYGVGATILDSMGTVQQASNAGTSGDGTPPPNWHWTAGQTTLDNHNTSAPITWTCLHAGMDEATPTARQQAVGACSYPQDLYVDESPWIRTLYAGNKADAGIATLNTENHWYYDGPEGVLGHGAYTVYVASKYNGNTAFNPNSHVIELTDTARHAFTGTTSANVLIQNLTMEHTTPSNQYAVVQPRGTTSYWTINGNWIWHNLGEGIKPLDQSGNDTISYNTVIENGEGGLHSGGGFKHFPSPVHDDQFIGNYVARNNIDNVQFGESGGSKFAGDYHAKILNNVFEYNNGIGLWADVWEYAATWSGNTATGNATGNMRWEYTGTMDGTNGTETSLIEDNTTLNTSQYSNQICVAWHVPLQGACDCCTGNKTGTCEQVGGAGSCTANALLCNNNQIDGNELMVLSGQNAIIGASGHHNTFTSNCGSVQMIQDNRAKVFNNTIQYNIVNFPNATAALGKRIGMQNAYPAGTPYNIFVQGNSFDYNAYHYGHAGAVAALNFNGHGTNSNLGNNCTTDPTSCWSALSFTNWQNTPSLQDVHGTNTNP